MPEEYEDVEATLEQGTTPDTSQKGKWRAIDWIAGSTLVAEALLSTIWAIVWVCGCRFEHQLQVYLALVLIILTGGYLALIFCPIFKKDDDPRWFHARILSSGIVGGSYAFLLPVVMSLPEGNVNSGGAAALRQAILLATGGLIALIALGETRRKNDNDREAAENLRAHQENMLIQQKEQFEANSFKERKAERRERYTKAVEQLGDEKAPVRMGGVYTLVGLVDEWLEEESLSENDKLKEGQVIINNLCAYIRSPFTLASHYDEPLQDTPTSEGTYKDREQEFYAEKAILDSEADVRLSIIKEIHNRLQGTEEILWGTWSSFEYNFSGSTFFYPVDLSDSYYLKSVNFSGSTYQNTADFSGSTYQNTASFGGSTYQRGANFSNSIYQGWISFGGSTYQDSVDFSDSTYRGSANFGGSTYKAETKFNDSFYESSVDFSNSTYYDRVEFHGYNLGSGYECLTYKGTANFSHSVYLGTPIFGPTTYEGRTIFSNSIYSEPVNFSSSNTYKDKVDFSSSTYHGKVSIGASAYESQSNFRDSLYAEGADFTFAAFKGPHYFDGSVFYKALDLHGSVSYKEEPIFTHDYPTYTDPRPEYDKINRHITLFPAFGNDFTIILQGNQDPLDIPNLLKYCNFLDSLIPEKIEDYNQIINEIIITRDNFKSTKNIQEKDKYAEFFKEKNKELYKWREEVTTIVLQNGVEVSN